MKMKLAELKLLCSELKLNVRGRVKAPYQEALCSWVDERGAGASVLQAPQAGLKVWHGTLTC